MAASVPTSRVRRSIRKAYPKSLTAELSCPDESVPKETTFTENVSTRGARVTTVRRWSVELVCWLLFSRMAFGLKEGSLTASARRRDFAIGVDLSGQCKAAWGT